MKSIFGEKRRRSEPKRKLGRATRLHALHVRRSIRNRQKWSRARTLPKPGRQLKRSKRLKIGGNGKDGGGGPSRWYRRLSQLQVRRNFRPRTGLPMQQLRWYNRGAERRSVIGTQSFQPHHSWLYFPVRDRGPGETQNTFAPFNNMWAWPATQKSDSRGSSTADMYFTHDNGANRNAGARHLQ